MPGITVLVSNDLTHDQRVKKVCESLIKFGFEPFLIGRKLPESVPLTRSYPSKRFKLLFRNGPLFYAELNLRLFFFLLFHKTDAILANDLDTLLPAFLVSRLRGKHLVYDSHEYFTEAAGLADNKFAKWFWLRIEKFIFPKLKQVYTVNESIASIYREQYKVDVSVIRNVPPKSVDLPIKSREDIGLPKDKYIVILQGAFMDINRGAKELAEASLYVQNTHFLFIGAGEEWEFVKRLSERNPYNTKITCIPKLPFDQLRQYTSNADLGISIDKDLYLNYKLSLPNKLFDYIHSNVPVLTSRLPELERVMEKYEIGLSIDSHDPEHIAEMIEKTRHSDRRDLWESNLKKAAQEYCWEAEEEVLKRIYTPLLD